MSAIVRVALSSFWLAWLQRWVNGLALLLIAVGAVLFLTNEASARGAFLFMMIGTVLLVLTPVFAGGVAMRFASTRSVMHLRPHGRTRMLLGSTLGITLLAALATMPFASLEYYMSVRGRAPDPRFASPEDAFLVTWALLAAAWVFMFAISRSAAGMALVGVLPVLVIGLGRFIRPLIPGTEWIFAAGVACWALFALWYLRTDSVRRPEYPMSGESSMNVEATLFGRLVALLDGPSNPVTRQQAMRQLLLGSTSSVLFVLTGLWVALIFVVVQLLTAGSLFRRAEQLMAMLPFVAFFNLSFGLATARRARLLWLRTGLDRAGLFALGEKWGLRAAMTTWLIASAPLLTLVALSQPDRAISLLMFLLLQATMAALLYYGGLASVAGWKISDILLSVVLSALLIAQLALFQPRHGVSVELQAYALPVALAAVLGLRSFAARRWQALDWRVAKLPRMTGRA